MHHTNPIFRTAWGFALLAFCAVASADQDKVLQFKSAAKMQQHLVILANTPHARVVRLLVANTDPAGPYDPVADQNQLIQSLKPGDLIQVSWDTAKGANTLSAIAHYTPKPGELTPNGYIFVSSEPKSEKSPDLIVTLNKLGDVTQFDVPGEKAIDGQVHRDPGIEMTLASLKEGDPVWADIAPGSGKTLAALLPYAEPQQGKLVKIEVIDVDGRRQPAAQIDPGGTVIEVEVPGTLKDEKWSVDLRIVSALHRCKVGEQVLFRSQLVEADNWLRGIEPVPTQPIAAQPGPSGTPDSGSNTDANGLPKGRTIGGGVPGVGGIGIGGF
jgi:hypothetical protein